MTVTVAIVVRAAMVARDALALMVLKLLGMVVSMVAVGGCDGGVCSWGGGNGGGGLCREWLGWWSVLLVVVVLVGM